MMEGASSRGIGRVGIAGAGRVGPALGRLLYEHGEAVVAVASRNLEHAQAAAAFIGPGVRPLPYQLLPQHATRILIAVPDHAIPEVASQLAQSGMRDGVALHTSGAHGHELLAALAGAGNSCGSLHPLQTFASPEAGVKALPGISFAIDGGDAARLWAEHIVAILGGRVLSVPAGSRILYHAAAALASNHILGLIAAACDVMAEVGIEERDALAALAPLVSSSVSNAFTIGPTGVLTGPLERGDVETVSVHLQALRSMPEPVRALYRTTGLKVLEIARRRGLSEDRAGALERLLKEDQ